MRRVRRRGCLTRARVAFSEGSPWFVSRLHRVDDHGDGRWCVVLFLGLTRSGRWKLINKHAGVIATFRRAR